MWAEIEQETYFNFINLSFRERRLNRWKASNMVNTDTNNRKALHRLRLLCKLKYLIVRENILPMLYRSLVESFLTFTIISWYKCLTSKQRKLLRIVDQAGIIISSSQTPLSICMSTLWSGSWSQWNSLILFLSVLTYTYRGGNTRFPWPRRKFPKGCSFPQP